MFVFRGLEILLQHLTVILVMISLITGIVIAFVYRFCMLISQINFSTLAYQVYTPHDLGLHL